MNYLTMSYWLTMEPGWRRRSSKAPRGDDLEAPGGDDKADRRCSAPLQSAPLWVAAKTLGRSAPPLPTIPSDYWIIDNNQLITITTIIINNDDDENNNNNNNKYSNNNNNNNNNK